MTPEFFAQDLIRQCGAPMTLKRRTPDGSFTDVTVMGLEGSFQPGTLIGAIEQASRKITISNAEIMAANWPGPPRKGDILLIEGAQLAIHGCDTKRLSGVVLAHVLWCEG